MIQLTIWKIQSEKITFNFLLNIARLLQSVIAVGIEFHIVIDRYGKDRCPAADLYQEANLSPSGQVLQLLQQNSRHCSLETFFFEVLDHTGEQ